MRETGWRTERARARRMRPNSSACPTISFTEVGAIGSRLAQVLSDKVLNGVDRIFGGVDTTAYCSLAVLPFVDLYQPSD